MADQFDHKNADFTRITRNINRMGYKTRRGNSFESRSVERILTNPFYYGLVVWNGVSFIGSHEVRFTKEQFDMRMDKIQKQFKPHKRHDISSCKHWLSGLLKCGSCGASLSYNGSNRTSPGFQCYKYSKGVHPGSMSISEKKAIAAVYEYFDKLLAGVDFEYEYRPPETDEQLSQYDSLLEELDKITSRERRIQLAFENGVDTLEEYKGNKERLKKARMDVQKQLDELHNIPLNQKPSREDVLAKVRTVYDVIKDPDVDYDTKGTFMRGLVEDIVYDKKNGRLIFHLYIS